MTNQNVCEAVYEAVGAVVYGVVNWAMDQAVDHAVDVAHAQPEEPLHPGLGLYLAGVA